MSQCHKMLLKPHSTKLQAKKQAVRLGMLMLITLSSACSTTGNMLSINEVKPWERGTLARSDMQLISDTMEQSIDDHIYFSKEASTGGVSVQGGGCGCN